MRTQDEDGYWEAEVERLREENEHLVRLRGEDDRELERLREENERLNGLANEYEMHLTRDCPCDRIEHEVERLRQRLTDMRVDKNEALEEVERLHTNAEMWHRKWNECGQENARLRRIEEAARDVLSGGWLGDLRAALKEKP